MTVEKRGDYQNREAKRGNEVIDTSREEMTENTGTGETGVDHVMIAGKKIPLILFGVNILLMYNKDK